MISKISWSEKYSANLLRRIIFESADLKAVKYAKKRKTLLGERCTCCTYTLRAYLVKYNSNGKNLLKLAAIIVNQQENKQYLSEHSGSTRI